MTHFLLEAVFLERQEPCTINLAVLVTPIFKASRGSLLWLDAQPYGT